MGDYIARELPRKRGKADRKGRSRVPGLGKICLAPFGPIRRSDPM